MRRCNFVKKHLNINNHKSITARRYHDKLFHDRNESGQMIVLTGALLCVLIITIWAAVSTLSGVGVDVPRSRASSIIPEFRNINEKLSSAINLYVVEGNESNIRAAINYTRNDILNLTLNRGNFFNLSCGNIEYNGLLEGYGYIFYADVSFILSDGSRTISKEKTISIYCEDLGG